MFRVEWTTCLLLLLSGGVRADEDLDAFFTREVEPILVGHCLECHGTDRNGGLDLRTADSLFQGGESGPVVVPGKPGESLLFEHVQGGEMPPENQLQHHEIAVLERWIRDGVSFPSRTLDPYSRTTKKRAGYDFWSLQPIRRPDVPAVVGGEAAAKSVSPIDAFIVAKLKEKGLSLATAADRRTFLRRVTYDLHGLPPTEAEVEAFLADESPLAYERVVDRLLASPRYGERWGRHWLDVVRYAESNGFERDRIRTNFWRYRDYVIHAFNEDMPYDQFVKEQLAGDVIRPGDPDLLVATGFLVAGPKNDVDTVSELERMITRQDELDDYVSAVGTTFMGLTLGCARCHDHKFDPVPSADYYALTAVFSGLDRADNVVAPAEMVAQRDKETRDLRQRIADAKTQLQRLAEPARARIRAQESVASEAEQPGSLPVVQGTMNEDPFAVVEARFVRMVIAATNSGDQPCLDELEVYGPDEERNLALASLGSKATASSLLPGFDIHQIAHLNDGELGNGRSWISNEPGKGTATIELPEPRRVHRVVWSRDRLAQFRDRLPVEYAVEVSLDGEHWTKVSSSKRRPPIQPGTPAAEEPMFDGRLLSSLSASEKVNYLALLGTIKTAEASIERLPPLPKSYSVVVREMTDTFVLHRGQVRERRQKVSPGALSAVKTMDANLFDPNSDSGPTRRLRLAEWIVDPRNPLPARVWVNRIWHYHFGTGLVGTPSDFGFQGERPSHPELLDWLASELVAGGWKTKRLHKLICMSEVYRQSSKVSPAARETDAGNRWLSHYPAWRLDAESLRDSILFVSGKLDPAIGGPSFRLFEYRDGNVPDYVLIDRTGPETWRRAVYMFNIRTFREPLLSAFDCPDPSVSTPARQRSTTALQALSLMNNPFMHEQSRFFAERVTKEAGPELPKQVAHAYGLALTRRPSAGEVERAVRFVQSHGLASFCRVLLNSNEFLYVR
ncbi:MAG: DUF1553 domain-containing protein [Planctomycetota bacterium]